MRAVYCVKSPHRAPARFRRLSLYPTRLSHFLFSKRFLEVPIYKRPPTAKLSAAVLFIASQGKFGQDDGIICKQEHDALIIAARPPHDAALKAAMQRLRASICAVLPLIFFIHPQESGVQDCTSLCGDIYGISLLLQSYHLRYLFTDTLWNVNTKLSGSLVTLRSVCVVSCGSGDVVIVAL